MSHWYLVSSLPYLRFGDKPPMSAKAFRAACVGWVADDERVVIDAALENREPEAGVSPAELWWNGEVQLRDAVVRVRAKNRGTDASRFIQPHDGFSVTIEKMVTDAFTRPDPMEQEMELDRARWSLVDELAVGDLFGFAAVLAFAVKVRIAERWAGLDEEAGKEKVEELILTATAENPETGIEV
ncbi:MAG: DUF2764 family protein [Kiritimatiellales bacterium]|nr:DUF2764 family protein [Kiritimatiellota bacterium]MBL7012007.1 DUF2764 family protein [Kiritimatiellales bacterium]